MARTLYGGTGGDVLAQLSSDGDFEPTTATFNVYTSRTGPTQLTDLQTLAGAAATSVDPDANGRVFFYGPDPYTSQCWLEDVASPGSTRWQVHRTDLDDTGGTSSVTAAQITDASPNARTFVTSADYAAMRTALGVTATSALATIATSGDLEDAASGSKLLYAQMPAGSSLYVYYNDATTTWPARPTGRTDMTVEWIGADELTAPPGAVPGRDMWRRPA